MPSKTRYIAPNQVLASQAGSHAGTQTLRDFGKPEVAGRE